jgi:hypothetical protein
MLNTAVLTKCHAVKVNCKILYIIVCGDRRINGNSNLLNLSNWPLNVAKNAVSKVAGVAVRENKSGIVNGAITVPAKLVKVRPIAWVPIAFPNVYVPATTKSRNNDVSRRVLVHRADVNIQ